MMLTLFPPDIILNSQVLGGTHNTLTPNSQCVRTPNSVYRDLPAGSQLPVRVNYIFGRSRPSSSDRMMSAGFRKAFRHGVGGARSTGARLPNMTADDATDRLVCNM